MAIINLKSGSQTLIGKLQTPDWDPNISNDAEISS